MERSQVLISELVLRFNFPDDAVVYSRADFFVIQSSAGKRGTKRNHRLHCQPHPSITWSKAVGSLPKGRTEVIKGNLTIYNVTKKDRGTFLCKAENVLGSASHIAQLTIFSRLLFKVCPLQEVTPVIGSTVRLPFVAESDLRPIITWTKDGRPSLPADSKVFLNGTLVLQNIKKSHEGSYTCC